MTALKDRAIFFTADRRFIVPTLVAAKQIHRQADVMTLTDILIFLVDFNDHDLTLIQRNFAHTGLIFIPTSSSRYTLPENASYRLTHVPASALARLTVGPDIPEQYKHLIYMDGDIQIVGSLLDLVTCDVPDNRLLAAADRPYVKIREKDKTAAETRHYLSEINVRTPEHYFNSGIMACTRSTWLDISQAALEYFFSHSEKCRFHDQSALNAVTQDRYLAMSPKYNCVSTYTESGMTSAVKPAIIHFTGAQKPWFAKSRPFKGRFIKTYKDFLATYPDLKAFPFIPSDEHSKDVDHHADRSWKLLRLVTPWRIPLRKYRMRRYLRKTRFMV